MSTITDRFCLATVTSPDFIPGTLVLINSFLRHNPWFDGDIVVISDGLDQPQQEALRIFPHVIFHQPDDDLLIRIGHLCNSVPGLTAKRRRFYSIEAFNLAGYDRLLFFDSDILVTGNIEHVLFNDESLLACSDQPTRQPGKVRSRTTFKRVWNTDTTDVSTVMLETFNAGFFVVGKKYLTQTVYRDLKQLVHKRVFSEILTHNTDQVVLNLYFDGQVRILPLIYNMVIAKWKAFQSVYKIDPSEIKVLHFTGYYKPWDPYSKLNDLHFDAEYDSFYRAWHAENELICQKYEQP
jgi:lipopolysaccharide biosynthesis glycosyltransferase